MAEIVPSKSFLIDANAGGWAYHEALGWIRNRAEIELFVYNDSSTFIIPDTDGEIYNLEQALTFEDIQSLHWYGGTFGGEVTLDITAGQFGFFSSFETQRATEILNPDGFTRPFAFGSDDRRVNASFHHNGNHITLQDIEGTTGIAFDGLLEVEVEDEEGNSVTNTVPHLHPGIMFTYRFNIPNSLSQPMFLYVDEILVGNPTFAATTSSGLDGERLLYSSGSKPDVNRVSYINIFGATINTGAPKRTTPWELTNADIVAAFPKLADLTERADSGTTSSLVSERLQDMNEEQIIGSTICFITGFSFGTDSTITSYDPETGGIAFTEIVDKVDSTTVFSIVYNNFFTYSHRAYGIIENDMRNRGINIDLFLNQAQVKELHLTKTLALICLAKRQGTDDIDLYHDSYLVYTEKYTSELTNLTADYDSNEDGIIQETEKSVQSEPIILVH